jgi:hypothetical protein
MSIRPNPATIRPFSCLRFLPGSGCVSLLITRVYGWLMGVAIASIEKYPAKSGRYPARRFCTWPFLAFGRNALSSKHIRRHQASQIGRVAIYPAMDGVRLNVRKSKLFIRIGMNNITHRVSLAPNQLSLAANSMNRQALDETKSISQESIDANDDLASCKEGMTDAKPGLGSMV